MPIPTPKKGESKKKFLSRCMENSVMVSDYKDEKQRYAVCNNQLNKKEKGEEDKNVNLDVIDKLIEKANKAMGKKLTTKDRKKLKKSTFCGPDKSFPVPECKHVAVAKAYLSRSNFSATTKKRIAACINRRAKELKCNVSKKAKAYTEYTYASLNDELKNLYDSDVFKETRKLVELSEKNPNMDLKCITCSND